MSEQLPAEPGSAIRQGVVQADAAWRALLEAARRTRDEDGFAPGPDAAEPAANSVRDPHIDAGGGLLVRDSGGRWARGASVPAEAAALLDLYLPVCNARPESPLTVGHLGQSLDGYIATDSGDSNFVTGPANIVHLHRMRALCDAIVVGAGTIASDDPRLTTRLVEGANPVRVVLDPSRRLDARYGVFSDGQAETILICDEQGAANGAESLGHAEVIGVPVDAGRLDLEALLARLAERGLAAVFVEGGGRTVSRFLEAGLLDRLQIAIAPLVTGAGTPGLRLPGCDEMAECLRPAHRVFSMGDDVLFDCDLGAGASPPRGATQQQEQLSRIV